MKRKRLDRERRKARKRRAELEKGRPLITRHAPNPGRGRTWTTILTDRD